MSRFGIDAIDRVTTSNRATSIRRLFPDAGIYEEAHRAYGLHLWYEFKFDSGSRADKVLRALGDLEYFDTVEQPKEYSFDNNLNGPLPGGTNDPKFNEQWNFENVGQAGGTAGADIKLRQAWSIETGNSGVVVAVIDAGIDFSHSDLIGSNWINTDEIPGNNIDDDHNGYVDDINGYNFGDGTGTIPSHPHATHVAGTIAATTNNSLGVSGIAGGTGNNDGVRLMSCVGFGNFGVGGFEAAMVYAADNGAVISQNSWGGGSTAIEVAINYFVARAGLDNSAANYAQNRQTGPMAGGIVVFAAGNGNTDRTDLSYPATYPKVIAVASTDRKDMRSGFSNYGTWVDISAPGTNILSTFPGGFYAVFNGTSMACPHVSGVAALIISRFRGPLTPTVVTNRLLFSADDLDQKNVPVAGLLGSGRLNAFRALQVPDGVLPGPITDLTADQTYHNSVDLTWTSPSVGGLPDGNRYEIRFSTSPITSGNFSSRTLVNQRIKSLAPGLLQHLTIDGLLPSRTYYIAIKTIDLSLEVSVLSNVVTTVTKAPPKLELMQASVSANLPSEGETTQTLTIRNTGEGPLLGQAVSGYMLQPTISSGRNKSVTNARLFAVNTVTLTIDRIDIQNGSIIHSIPMPEPTPGVLQGLAYDGKFLYYGNGYSKKIYQLNPSTGVVIKAVSVPTIQSLDGLGYSGEYIYIQDNKAFRIYEFDFPTGTIVRELPPGPASSTGGLSFGGTRGTIFLSQYLSLYEVNRTTGAVIKSKLNNDLVRGVAYSESAETLFVANTNSQTITAVDPNTLAVKYTVGYGYSSALAADESPYQWLKVSQAPFILAPDQNLDIDVSFDVAGLNQGTYQGYVAILSNDVAIPVAKVPVSLTVTSASDISVNKNHIEFGDQYINQVIDSVVTIENRGPVNLTISSVVSDSPLFSASLTSSNIAPGVKANLVIHFSPVAEGNVSGVITLQTNDPDENQLQIQVSSKVFQLPLLDVSTPSIEVTLATGEATVSNFDVINPGAGPLRWKAQIESSGFSSGGFHFLHNPIIPFALFHASVPQKLPQAGQPMLWP